MRIVIIGGSGHVGSYLVPRLVNAGHQIVSISRGRQKPYQPNAAWNCVEQLAIDRIAEEMAGTFGKRIIDLKPDAVIDLICFRLDSARHLVNSLREKVNHYLFCGSIWVYGPSIQVPTTEEQPRNPIDDYGVQKAAIEAYLLDEARRNHFPATILHPGHIVGPGWIPLNPAGNFNLQVFTRIIRGEGLALPNFGMETLHHVHADDVAQGFLKALANWNNAIGQSFHLVSPAALTLRGYAEAVAFWFGRKANLRFLPWEEWRKTVTPEEAATTLEHITHSPNCSIEKARRLLDYRPRYHSLEALQEAIDYLVQHQIIDSG